MLYSALFFIVYILFNTVGFFILFQDTKQKRNVLFFSMMILFSIWAIINTALFLITDPEIAAVVRRNAVFSWGIVYSVIFHFVLEVSGSYKYLETKFKSIVIKLFIYLPALLNFYFYLGSSYQASELIKTEIGWTINPSFKRDILWTNYFYVYYIGFMLLSIAVLVHWRVKTTVLREVKQSNLLIIGFSFALIIASIFEIVLPLNGYAFPYGITLVAVLIPLSLIGYAINKYGFLSLGSQQIGKEIMSISNEGIIICDTKGIINEINFGGLTILKRKKHQFLSLMDLGFDEGLLKEVKSKKITIHNGTDIHLLVSSKKLYDKLGEHFGYLIMFLDIQELDKAQKLLEAYSETLEQQVNERTEQLQSSNNMLYDEISNRKESEKRVSFMAHHDFLTGLFNRRYYESMLEVYDNEEFYPLTIVVADINGLKLINDAFGHCSGDELLVATARIIETNCKEIGFAARIGGDEFLMLLKNTSSEEADVIIENIKEKAKKTIVQSIALSISFGHSTKSYSNQLIHEVYRVAEDLMYREKLLEIPSMRSNAIETILNTLYEKDEKSEIHSRKVSDLCEQLALKMGLSHQEVSTVKTAGLLHDIGKIIIPTDILTKSGKLTSDEYSVIKNHTEIGFRILNSIPNMREIAIIVLNHHERFDGTGYPRGVVQDDIPFLSRIICVADAFDAMISERTYKKTLTLEEAKNELIRYSGTQFDPKIVSVVIDNIDTIKF